MANQALFDDTIFQLVISKLYGKDGQKERHICVDDLIKSHCQEIFYCVSRPLSVVALRCIPQHHMIQDIRHMTLPGVAVQTDSLVTMDKQMNITHKQCCIDI